MGKLKLAVTREGMEEALEDQGDLVLPDKGMYILELVSVTPGYKKDDSKDGGVDKSRPNAKFQWKIVGVGREGEKPEDNFMHIFDYVAFSEASQWKVDEVAAALGLSLKGKAKSGNLEIEIDPGKPGTSIGTQVLGRIKHETQEGYDTSPKIAKLLPLADADKVPDAFGDDDDETSDDAPEDDPFGGEDEEAGDDGDGDDELLTMEELEEMEPKDLAATAAEFDIDISSFTGKGRSDAAKKKDKMRQVREAIIEAQGDSEDGDDGDDDDDDPF